MNPLARRRSLRVPCPKRSRTESHKGRDCSRQLSRQAARTRPRPRPRPSASQTSGQPAGRINLSGRRAAHCVLRAAWRALCAERASPQSQCLLTGAINHAILGPPLQSSPGRKPPAPALSSSLRMGFTRATWPTISQGIGRAKRRRWLEPTAIVQEKATTTAANDNRERLHAGGRAQQLPLTG